MSPARFQARQRLLFTLAAWQLAQSVSRALCVHRARACVCLPHGSPPCQTVLRSASLGTCRYQGQVSAALVLGGMDCTGPSLYTIYPHGSTDKVRPLSVHASGAGYTFMAALSRRGPTATRAAPKSAVAFRHDGVGLACGHVHLRERLQGRP